MKISSQDHAGQVFSIDYWVRIVLLAALAFPGGIYSASAQQCSFTSPSDGSDGDYDLSNTPAGTVVYFNASNFKGTGVANNVFNFGKITIPAGVTVKFTESVFHGSVYWLATGDVTIAGSLDLTGENGVAAGTDPTTRHPAVAGSGGYPGGVGGGGPLAFIATPGGGPGGGAIGNPTQATDGFAGTFTGSNDYLVPLIGGSGGGGGYYSASATSFGYGGGGGGGAIMIASSTAVNIAGNGNINAYAGAGVCSAHGSGGSIFLEANTISIATTEALYAWYRSGCGQSGSPGVIRLEACSIVSSVGTPTLPVALTSTPTKVFLPSAPVPQLRVTSINGTTITENPFTFPDIQINTASSVPVVITAHQVPVGTIPTLYILSETGDQQLQCTGGLQGTLATSTCTINIAFNFGGSRGFVRATWAQ